MSDLHRCSRCKEHKERRHFGTWRGKPAHRCKECENSRNVKRYKSGTHKGKRGYDPGAKLEPWPRPKKAKREPVPKVLRGGPRTESEREFYKQERARIKHHLEVYGGERYCLRFVPGMDPKRILEAFR